MSLSSVVIVGLGDPVAASHSSPGQGRKADGGRRKARHAPRRVEARYDAAQTTDSNRKHWAGADDLSADAANSKGVRDTLAKRARYEVANGGYAKGMVRRYAIDLVGTGPRLQMLTEDEATNKWIEREWLRWSRHRRVRLAKKLRTFVMCRLQSGEGVALLVQDDKLPTLSKLNWKLLEPEQMTTPDLTGLEANRVDGVDVDKVGEPERYWILPVHPTSPDAWRKNAEAYDPQHVIHWYSEDRPQQHRGVPDLTPSLRLFADHRRFLKATIDAAESAARFAAVVHTKNAAAGDEEDDDGPEPMDTFELEPAAVTVLPDGYELGQVKAEHPATTFGEFNDQIVTEEALPIGMTRNVASGSSADYNYASMRGDFQSYDFAGDVDRDDLEIVAVEPTFEAWLRETLAEKSGIAPSDVDLSLYPHTWHWDRRGHVDPQKERNAQDTALGNGSTNHPREYAKEGLDWKTEFEAAAKALGITLEEYQALIRKKLFASGQSQAQPAPRDDDDDERGTGKAQSRETRRTPRAANAR